MVDKYWRENRANVLVWVWGKNLEATHQWSLSCLVWPQAEAEAEVEAESAMVAAVEAVVLRLIF